MKLKKRQAFLLGFAIAAGLLLAASEMADASTTTTPNMSLILPVPGTEPGPAWAQELNTALGVVDSHNHAPGSGVQVPSAGINVNADLACNNYNLSLPRSIMFTSQPSALSTPNDKSNIYVVNGDLWYNNSSGTAVQVTSGGAVNVAGSGNISGMGGTTAAVTYSNTTKTFSFTQSSGVTADIAAGSYNLYQDVSSANPITLKSPASLATAYTITFPTALPGSGTKICTITSAGQMACAYDVDNSTLQVSSNLLGVKANGITASQIANNTITATQIANNTITATQLANQTITATQIANGTITGTQISGGTLTDTQIATGGISGVSLANNIALPGVPQAGSSSPIALVGSAASGTTLKITRGHISSSGSITAGEGFTVTHTLTGVYGINYSTSYSSAPIVIATLEDPGVGTNCDIGVSNSSTTSQGIVDIYCGGGAANMGFHFLAIGPK